MSNAIKKLFGKENTVDSDNDSEAIKIVRESEFFDDEWYRKEYSIPDNEDCAEHYYKIGYKLGYNPSTCFSTNEYFECNVDVKEVDKNPLYHYEKYGRDEKRILSINFDGDEKVEEEVEAEEVESVAPEVLFIQYSEFFDEKWYRETYNIPNDENAAEHYYKLGYKLGYNPSLLFSTDGYFKWNEDVKNAGVNPLEHYELYGKKELRIINYVE